MKILIVEDSHMMGMACKALLVAAGHQVSWILGAKSLSPFVGIQADKSDLEIAGAKFDLCFCDGQLEGNFSGPEICAVLSKLGVVTVGMSTEAGLNKSMIENGACAGFNKAYWFLGLITKVLEPLAIVTDPQAVQSLESKLEADAANKEVRRQADELLMSYIKA